MSAIASFAALLVVALGYGVIVPLAPALVTRSLGPVPVESLSFHTGALSATYLFAFAALAPFWGRAADGLSRRAIACGGLAGSSASFAAMAIAGRLELMYPALALAGACSAAVVPAIQVEIGRLEGDVAKARRLAILGAASFTGWFLGPPLASWSMAAPPGASSATGLPLGLVAALGLASAVAMYATGAGASESGTPRAAGASHATKHTSSWTFGLFALAITFGIGAFEVSLVLWATQVMGLGSAAVSRMLVECTIVMMAVQALIFLVPAALPRWRPAVVAGALLAMAFGTAMTPMASQLWMVFAAVGILGAAATLLQAMVSLGTITSAGNRTGAALGLQLALSSAGQALGSFSGGAFFSPTGRGFYVSAAFLAVMAVYAATAGVPRANAS